MPYIDPDARPELDGGDRQPENAGELNYAVSRLVDAYLVRRGFRYTTVNEVVGVLECAKLELYRRLAAPYEDGKIEANGDVYKSGPS